ncbi:hypothetical protein ACSBR2_011747 [Camellia fascicularis]
MNPKTNLNLCMNAIGWDDNRIHTKHLRTQLGSSGCARFGLEQFLIHYIVLRQYSLLNCFANKKSLAKVETIMQKMREFGILKKLVL